MIYDWKSKYWGLKSVSSFNVFRTKLVFLYLPENKADNFLFLEAKPNDNLPPIRLASPEISVFEGCL